MHMVIQIFNKKNNGLTSDSNKEKRVGSNICREILRALKTAFPLMLSVIPFGLLLGAQAKIHGLSTLELWLMCSLNFAGGSEFVAINLWQKTPPLLLIVAMTLLVNCRHILMGATMIQFCKHFSLKRILPSFFFLCDECWALSLQDCYHRLKKVISPSFSYIFYMTVGVSLYLVWVTSAVIGILLGPLFGNLLHYGFDMAFAAIFIVLLRGMWLGWRKGIIWASSLITACIVYMFVPGEWYVIAGTLTGIIFVFLVPNHMLQASKNV